MKFQRNRTRIESSRRRSLPPGHREEENDGEIIVFLVINSVSYLDSLSGSSMTVYGLIITLTNAQALPKYLIEWDY